MAEIECSFEMAKEKPLGVPFILLLTILERNSFENDISNDIHFTSFKINNSKENFNYKENLKSGQTMPNPTPNQRDMIKFNPINSKLMHTQPFLKENN